MWTDLEMDQPLVCSAEGNFADIKAKNLEAGTARGREIELLRPVDKVIYGMGRETVWPQHVTQSLCLPSKC
jgi:hypothetical protein